MGLDYKYNNGPQDSMLIDNSKSHWQNVGYMRTSNFSEEIRDIDPQNSTKNFGQTVRFVIPKAGDKLKDLTLQIDLNNCDADSAYPVGMKKADWDTFDGADGTLSAAEYGFQSGGDVSKVHRPKTYAAWVEALGYACIEKMTLAVGSHDIETITGEQLMLMNSLSKQGGLRNNGNILKTGAGAMQFKAITCYKQNQDLGTTDGIENQSIAVLADAEHGNIHTSPSQDDVEKNRVPEDSRLIYAYGTVVGEGHHLWQGPKSKKQLIIPLSFFFAEHPSKAFPLVAIAGSNDLSVSIKFRDVKELVQIGRFDWQVGKKSNLFTGDFAQTTATAFVNGATELNGIAPFPGSISNKEVKMPVWTGSGGPVDKMSLRATYVHLTTPEATATMQKEHVRLLKQWQVQRQNIEVSDTSEHDLANIDLSFLHPVSELIIVIRKSSEMTSDVSGTGVSAFGSLTDTAGASAGPREKNWFAFHGSGKNPNVDAFLENIIAGDVGGGAGAKYADNSEREVNGTAGRRAFKWNTDRLDSAGNVARSAALRDGAVLDDTIKVTGMKLSLNGQQRHPALSNVGASYSNTIQKREHHPEAVNQSFYDASVKATNLDSVGGDNNATVLKQIAAQKDGNPGIFHMSFALNPEGQNPSGHINFSRVQHAKLTIRGRAVIGAQSYVNSVSKDSAQKTQKYEVSVFAINYNWLQVKQGRAITSFSN